MHTCTPNHELHVSLFFCDSMCAPTTGSISCVEAGRAGRDGGGFDRTAAAARVQCPAGGVLVCMCVHVCACM